MLRNKARSRKGKFIITRFFYPHMRSFTAIIRKGERQMVALCPELDVVSQGSTVEAALQNLKEAVELYIEEMGIPEGVSSGGDTIVVNFEVKHHGKTAQIVR